MEKMREEFEAWAIDHHFSATKKQDGVSYAHDSTMCAFEGWKASRAALRVELPVSCEAGGLHCDREVYEAASVRDLLDKVGVRYE